MKHFRKITGALILLMLSVAALVGCSAKEIGEPEDVIRDAYGNEQFSISFSADHLDKPIPKMLYSAKNMPILPTPERVGYIFSGWYLDSGYTVPYTDGLLYLFMKDVTMYAKWEKEEFTQEGVYDVKISAKIDEILSKGEWADRYPMNDITKDINEDAICIEKSEKGLLFKFQYQADMEKGGFGNPVYTVTHSSLMGDKIHLSEKIAPENSTTKTLYFNIDKFNIAEPMYLDVITMNYADRTLSEKDRLKTRTEYRIEVKIEKLVGFSRPFADKNLPLEKNSYYLIKTHYNSMAETYNPVYSYIYVDGQGRYTLIKPFMPYTGLISSGIKENLLENYHHRGMSFSPMQIYYRMYPEREYSKDEWNRAEYLPSLVKGGYYGKYAVEFHHDTGKYYMIYDLGTELKGEFMISGAVTGFMEMMDGMGRYDMKMTLDYDHIIQLAEIDYRPLEGSAYVYNEDVQYYPGLFHDLEEQDLIKDSVDQYGLSTNMFNFYYSAKSIKEKPENRKVYSHRYVVTPTANTASRPTADARYQIATFHLTTSVFGYDPQNSEKLFGDSMSVNTFSGSGRRETIEILTGKMLQKGSEIRLENLFLEKVNPNLSPDDVKATVYKIKNKKIDYTSGEEIANICSSYTFTSPVAIEFLYVKGESIYKTPVILKEYQKPQYEDLHESDGYKQFDMIPLYDFSYRFGEHQNRFLGNYYVDEKEPTFDPIYTAVMGIRDGKYTLSYLIHSSTEFELENVRMYVLYECNNEFREVEMVYLEYNADKGKTYRVMDGDTVLEEGRLFYDEEGVRRPIGNYGTISEEMHDWKQIETLLEKKYDLYIDEEKSLLTLTSCTVYTGSGKQYIYENFSEIIGKLLKEKGYGVLSLTFGNGFDEYRKTVIFNIKLDGKEQFQIFHANNLFTEYEYIFKSPNALLPDGVVVDDVTIAVFGESYNDRYLLKDNNGQYSLIFLTPGVYEIRAAVTLYYDIDGNRVLNGEKTKVILSQKVKVSDIKKNVSITYITDQEHPFLENIPYYKAFLDGREVYCYKVSQMITEDFLTLNQVNYFKKSKDTLYAWSPRPWSEYTIVDADRMTGVHERVEDAIGRYGTDEIMLYAVWDEGITVHIDMNKDVTGQDSYDDVLFMDQEHHKGFYIINPPKTESVFVPKGYVFTGWTVLETGEFYSKRNSPSILTRTPVTVKATFIADITIRFDVDSAFGKGIPSKTVLENEILQAPKMECKEGYTFVGFRLATAFDKYGRSIAVDSKNFDFNTRITTDLVNYKNGITSIVVFVAVFEDENGNEVWRQEVTP